MTKTGVLPLSIESGISDTKSTATDSLGTSLGLSETFSETECCNKI